MKASPEVSSPEEGGWIKKRVGPEEGMWVYAGRGLNRYLKAPPEVSSPEEVGWGPAGDSQRCPAPKRVGNIQLT